MAMSRFIFDNMKLNELDKNNYSSITSHNIDLKNTKYSLRDLGFLIENASISLRSILATQKLNGKFCSKYIRNNYASGDSDKDITYREILSYQPHISENDLIMTITP